MLLIACSIIGTPLRNRILGYLTFDDVSIETKLTYTERRSIERY